MTYQIYEVQILYCNVNVLVFQFIFHKIYRYNFSTIFVKCFNKQHNIT